MWWLRSWVWWIMNAQEMLAVIIWLENVPSNFTPLLPISLQLKPLSSVIIHASQPQKNISLDSRSFIPVLGAKHSDRRQWETGTWKSLVLRVLSIIGHCLCWAYSLPSAEPRGEDFCLSHWDIGGEWVNIYKVLWAPWRKGTI